MNNNIFKDREYNLMLWVAYWRKNPHKFVKDYLGMNLFLYQKIIIYMIDKINWFMYIAARGQGKSFIIAVYAVARCILYPNTRIVLASGTKGQARLIITEKIVSMYNDSEAVRKEIGDFKNIKQGTNDTSVSFLNGSKISAVTSSDNARGYRGNILIVDEFRMVDKEIVDGVLKPFLNVMRQPPYMSKPEYKHLPKEENKEIYISSAWYRTNWIWGEFKRFLGGMMEHKSFFTMAIPYQLSVKHGLLDLKRVEEDRMSDTFDDMQFQMEYEAMFPSENDRGYFKLDSINKCRTVNKTFIPPTNAEFIENRDKAKPKNLSNIPRVDRDNEIRLVGLDIALMGSNKNVKNDTSAFTLMRLIRDGDTYRRDVVYLESINRAIETEDLAVRLKQLYYDFEADYVVMDANGNGLGVYDACGRILLDEERDVEYEPWTCINDDSMRERTKGKGVPIIYSMKGTADLNHEIAVGLKSSLEKGKLKLPMNDIQKRDDLASAGGFVRKNAVSQARELYSYQQATALASELVALEYKIISGNIKIVEVGNATKDRYSSLAYTNKIANDFERKLQEENEEYNMEDYIFITSYMR